MAKKYILTGGPGSGKSTTLAELAKRKRYVLNEVAGYLIKRELARKGNILPWTDRDRFQKRVLEKQLCWEREIPEEIEYSFQDRGIPDGIAYYKLDGLEPPRELVEAAKQAGYRGVFLLEPLQIYKNTEIRREDRETGMRIHNALEETYRELGYEIMKIPPITIETRADMILERVYANELLLSFEESKEKEPEMATMGGRI